MSNPWTPGTWTSRTVGDGRAELWTGRDHETHGGPLFAHSRPTGMGYDHRTIIYTSQANADLIALAPEMAEAILASVRDEQADWDLLCVVAEKLNAIGTNDE